MKERRPENFTIKIQRKDQELTTSKERYGLISICGKFQGNDHGVNWSAITENALIILSQLLNQKTEVPIINFDGPYRVSRFVARVIIGRLCRILIHDDLNYFVDWWHVGPGDGRQRLIIAFRPFGLRELTGITERQMNR